MANFPRTVLFNDGEALDFSDLNSMQRRQLAFINDSIFSYLTRIREAGEGGASASACYALGTAGAIYAGGADRESRFTDGPVMQRFSSAEPGGDTPLSRVYHLSDNEIGQIHNPATTNPRWDVISVRIRMLDDASSAVDRDFEDAVTRAKSTASLVKVHRATLEVTVTEGTEAASPTEPAVPAGHVKLAAVLVTPGMGAFDPKTDMRDYRIPLGPFRIDDFDTKSNGVFSEAVWTRATVGVAADGSPGRSARWFVGGGGHRRLLQVGVTADWGAGSVAELVRLDMADSGLSVVETKIADLTDPGAGGYGETDFRFATPPVWMNGYAAGYAVERLGPSGGTVVATHPGHEVAAIRYTTGNAENVRQIRIVSTG